MYTYIYNIYIYIYIWGVLFRDTRNINPTSGHPFWGVKGILFYIWYKRGTPSLGNAPLVHTWMYTALHSEGSEITDWAETVARACDTDCLDWSCHETFELRWV